MVSIQSSMYFIIISVIIILLFPLLMKSVLYAVKDYAEEGQFEMKQFAIPSLDPVKNEWTFTWREDKEAYFDQNNFDLLVLSYGYFNQHLVL